MTEEISSTQLNVGVSMCELNFDISVVFNQLNIVKLNPNKHSANPKGHGQSFKPNKTQSK